MDWVRGVLGGGGRAAGDPKESATLLPSVARDASVVREMSFADILAASQQQPPLEPEVVKQPGRAVVRARDAATAGLDGAKPAADGTEEVILTVDAGSRQPGPQLGSLPASNAPRERPAPLPNSTRAAVRATAYGVTNLASVVAIVFANKLVLFTHGFHFAATLTLMHCIFTSLGMAVLASVGFFEVKRVPLARSVPVAAVYVGTIVLNNLSIQLNTVGFYQASGECIRRAGFGGWGGQLWVPACSGNHDVECVQAGQGRRIFLASSNPFLPSSSNSFQMFRMLLPAGKKKQTSACQPSLPHIGHRCPR